MNFKFQIAFLLLFLFLSCENIEKRKISNVKETKKRDLVFKNINDAWNFQLPIHQNYKETIEAWTQWKEFLDEIILKPSASVSAYKYKVKTLSKKVSKLEENIPVVFNVNTVQCRVSTITTHIKMLELYFNLNKIPEKEVLKLIAQTEVEINSLQFQLDKIVKRTHAPEEEGEKELLNELKRKSDSVEMAKQNQPKI